MDTPDSTTKRCSKCGEYKPATPAYFNRNKNLADGLNRWCKDCTAKASKRWYEANYERVKATSKAYHEANREQKNANSSAWQKEHHEERRRYMRAYYDAHRETLQENKREWRKANPDLVRAAKHRRFAHQRSLLGEFNAVDWRRALDYFGGCCAVCGRQPGLWHTLAADHWIPLSSPECPGTVAWNIVPLCHGEGGCNNSKYNKDAVEWLLAKFGKRKGRAIQQRIESFLNDRRK